jgi:hypothetical protein
MFAGGTVVGVLVRVAVSVGVTGSVGVLVAVAVTVGVNIGVAVLVTGAVFVGVAVAFGVLVAVAVLVRLTVGVCVQSLGFLDASLPFESSVTGGRFAHESLPDAFTFTLTLVPAACTFAAPRVNANSRNSAIPVCRNLVTDIFNIIFYS